MKPIRTISTGFLLLAVVAVSVPAEADQGFRQPPGLETRELEPIFAENIILVVPDGMGLADVTAARIFRNGPDGDPLNLERLDFVGYQRTHSSSSTITDSAAAASAWSCGEKFYNGSICWRVNDPSVRDYPDSILEIARDRGLATGLVATSTVTHATPAAFGAHIHSRSCENEIARQYVVETGVDVILGGGYQKFADRGSAESSFGCPPAFNWIPTAEENGYTVVSTKGQMDAALESGVRKILGLFAAGGMTPEIYRSPDTTEPHLADMTAAALEILEKDPDGFFLLIEGSQIDWANHARNFHYQLGEMLAFDDAVGTVLEWVNSSPRRRRHTLVVVVPDHETGGFAINGPYGRLSKKGEWIQPGWTSGGHTAVDTLIWSQGPQAFRLARPLDNTDLYRVMLEALK
jgi:alkaline phosphatase